jgi:hypothetical protein
MPKLRMKIHIAGITSVGEGKTYTDIHRGDTVETDERTAHQFLTCGYAQADLKGPLGQPGKPEEIPNW